MMKEQHNDILKRALSGLPEYEPDAQLWNQMDEKLGERPLLQALHILPEYQPDDGMWEMISKGTLSKSNWSFGSTWYVAASLLLMGAFGFWLMKSSPRVSFSEEVADIRLQVKDQAGTDLQYEKLLAYCETEALVCNSKNFKQLTREYETLQEASRQLQQAIGGYNTEPGLVRQFTIVEDQKAELLNKMAKQNY